MPADLGQSFYRSPAMLVEKHGPCAPALKEYSLDEVRAAL
jgi:hypothetical protein